MTKHSRGIVLRKSNFQGPRTDIPYKNHTKEFHKALQIYWYCLYRYFTLVNNTNLERLFFCQTNTLRRSGLVTTCVNRWALSDRWSDTSIPEAAFFSSQK